MDIQFLTELSPHESVNRDRLRSCSRERNKKLALFILSSLSLFILATMNTVYILRSYPRWAPLLLVANATVASKLFHLIIYPLVPKIASSSKEESRLKKILQLPDLPVQKLDSNSTLNPFTQKIFQEFLCKIRAKTFLSIDHDAGLPRTDALEKTIKKYHLPTLCFYAHKAIEKRPDSRRIHLLVSPKDSLGRTFFHQLICPYGSFSRVNNEKICPIRFIRTPKNFRIKDPDVIDVEISSIDFLSGNNYPNKIHDALGKLQQTT